MHLNLADFLAELLHAECSMSVSKGIVTFEDGDTFDASPYASSGEHQVTPVEAAGLLAAIKDDEPAIVAAFRSVDQGERNRLGLALASLYSVLNMESKFQPALLAEPIKIPVSTFEEGQAVQRALFGLGCGYHHGRFPLAPDLVVQCLRGILVSRKGVMSVVLLKEHGSIPYMANHTNREVSPATVLAATTPADLLSS